MLAAEAMPEGRSGTGNRATNLRLPTPVLDSTEIKRRCPAGFGIPRRGSTRGNQSRWDGTGPRSPNRVFFR